MDKIKIAIKEYENIGRQYCEKDKYALCTRKKCPECNYITEVALGNSEVYQCPKCGDEGRWLIVKNGGFFEYRDNNLVNFNVLWPIEEVK